MLGDCLLAVRDHLVSVHPDREADAVGQCQPVEQRLLLRHVDHGEIDVVLDDARHVVDHVGALDHLSAPGSACQVLQVEALAHRPLAVDRSADVGHFEHEIGDLLAELADERLVGRVRVLDRVVQPTGGDGGVSAALLFRFLATRSRCRQ